METMSKLYLELAATLPATVKSGREVRLEDQRDKLGVTLMLIAHGCSDPQLVAKEALEKLEAAKSAQ